MNLCWLVWDAFGEGQQSFIKFKTENENNKSFTTWKITVAKKWGFFYSKNEFYVKI